MSNDKITYNDELKRLQTTQIGRAKIDQLREGLVGEQYKYIRAQQLKQLYNKYLDDRFSSNKYFYPGHETSLPTLQNLFKNSSAMAIDTMDAEIVRMLAEMTERGREIQDISFVADELRCAKMIIEAEHGVNIPTRTFCKDTEVLQNAQRIADLKANAQIGFSDQRSIPVEAWGKVGYGQPYNLQDLLPRDIPPKSFFDKLTTSLKSLVQDKKLGDVVIGEEDKQK